MSDIKLRPRFEKVYLLTEAEIIDRLKGGLIAEPEKCIGKVSQHHILLKVPYKDEHYWSPQLSINLEPDEEGKGTLVRGLFAPKPAVWTMFVFIYAALAFLTTIGVMYGLSQMTLEDSPTAMWSLPIGIVLILIVYGIARTGRAIGGDQTRQLYDFFMTSLSEK